MACHGSRNIDSPRTLDVRFYRHRPALADVASTQEASSGQRARYSAERAPPSQEPTASADPTSLHHQTATFQAAGTDGQRASRQRTQGMAKARGKSVLANMARGLLALCGPMAAWTAQAATGPTGPPPTNHAVAPRAVESQQPHELRTTSETGHLATDMQTALNVARKAETRVSKLHEAYEKAQEQWVAHEQLAKLNFQKERRRYMRDLERIEKEALEAEDQQEQTRATVRQIALREAQAHQGPVLKAATTADPQVAALFKSWAGEDGAALAGVLPRAFQAKSDAPTTPARTTAAPPRTPATTCTSDA